MQHHPDTAALLIAIAKFLERDVRPALADKPALAFRALVAANLATIAAAETKLADELERAELERMMQLFPDITLDEPISPATREARAKSLAKLNDELCAKLRDGTLSAEENARALEHVMQTLRGELLAYSPRFETSPDVE